MTSASSILVRFAPLLALGALAGCTDGGTDSDGANAIKLVGMYEVTSLTRNEISCDMEGEEVTGTFAFPYFELTATGDAYRFDECASADPESCDGSFAGNPWNDLVYEPGEDGTLRGAMAFAAVASPPQTCVLEYREGILSTEADAVRIEARAYGENGSLDMCTNEEAESRGTAMPCRGYHVVAGRKVP